jgi:ABC-type polysaccharide/polyol phosphate export permease
MIKCTTRDSSRIVARPVSHAQDNWEGASFFFFSFRYLSFHVSQSLCICLAFIIISLFFCLFLAELWVCYHHTSSTLLLFHTHKKKKNLILWTQVRHKINYFSLFPSLPLCFYLFLFVSLFFIPILTHSTTTFLFCFS